MTDRCAVCGATTVLTHQLRRGRCPGCRPASAAETVWEWITAIVVALTVVAWRPRLGDVVFAVVVFMLLAPAVAALHELAHAAAAKLLGWRVFSITIGGGKPWLRFGNIRIGRNFLGTGGTLAGPVREPVKHLALYYAAPLLVHAALIAALAPFARTYLAAALALILNASWLLWNTWPRARIGPYNRRPTDGWYLRRLARDPAAAVAAVRRIGLLGSDLAAAEELADDPVAQGYLAAVHFRRGDPEKTLQRIGPFAQFIEDQYDRSWLDQSDADLAARGALRGAALEDRCRIQVLTALDRIDEVIAIARERADLAASDEARALWRSTLARALLLKGGDLPAAEEAARYAHERLPWLPGVLVTWGIVLAEKGRWLDAEATFVEAGRRDRHGATTQAREAWHAVALAGLGKRDLAEQVVARMREQKAWPAYLRRAERATATDQHS